MKITANFLGAIRGQQRFPSFPFNILEDQAAPQNSFVSNKLVVSIPTAPTNDPRHHFLPKKGESVTYVSDTIRYLCLESLTYFLNGLPISRDGKRRQYEKSIKGGTF
jgi:hypothetical protein